MANQMIPDKTTENPEAMLYRAAEIKQQIKTLEEEYKMLEPQVLVRVKELSAGKDKYALQVGEMGVFIVAKYRKWIYSQAVQNTEALLKESKKREEADGTATAEEKDILKFNPIKDDAGKR